ncbi:putative trans-zeatin O-beta-D-glucosyltransferase [Helianthus anomalus]
MFISRGFVIVKELEQLGRQLEFTLRQIWCIRNKRNRQWLDENGFKLRIKGRGFLIHGWAPQVLILLHRAAGFFMTPCCVCSFFSLRKVEFDFLKCHLYLCLCMINQIAIKLLTFLCRFLI